jgi:hypothetical protein
VHYLLLVTAERSPMARRTLQLRVLVVWLFAPKCIYIALPNFRGSAEFFLFSSALRVLLPAAP